MRDIFLISDTHFGQRFAVRFFKRPFKNIKEMHDTLIENWNNNIREDDLVLILGDFYGGNKIFSHFLLKKLNGEKILVKGNHDFKFRLKRLIETRKIKIYNRIEFLSICLRNLRPRPLPSRAPFIIPGISAITNDWESR